MYGYIGYNRHKHPHSGRQYYEPTGNGQSF